MSIIGRFLEHDRIYWFRNGGDPEVFIGSADWRQRNLGARVEAMVPVRAEPLRDRLTRILEWALEDNRLAWELGPDGQYIQLSPAPGEEECDFHQRLMRDAVERATGGTRLWEVREG